MQVFMQSLLATLQAMWYEIHSGRAFLERKDYGRVSRILIFSPRNLVLWCERGRRDRDWIRLHWMPLPLPLSPASLPFPLAAALPLLGGACLQDRAA